METSFKLYLLTEETTSLGLKVGDILTALKQLDNDAPKMGKRHLMRLIKNIVKQIRRIIHSSWSFENEKHLKVLQKIGVALMKGLDTNEDLVILVSSASDELDQLSEKIGEPINNLAAPAISRDNTDADQD